MNLATLPITQREALIACVRFATLRRTRGGYRPAQPGIHAMHTTRAVNALVRAGLATYTDGEVEIQPTDAARELVAAAQATPTQRRSAAA